MTNAIHEFSADIYHSDTVGLTPTLSASIANILLNQSPAHARAAHPRLNPSFQRTEEAKFDTGNVVHAMLLENASIVHVCDFPDWRTKAAKEARDIARAHGRVPLLTHQHADVLSMYEAVATQIANLNVDPIPLTAGKPEQTLTWTENGVACRARIDWLHDDLSAIDDLKTSSRANPDIWKRRALFDHGCDVQASLYLRGIKAVTGATPSWRWIVVETTPPYALSVIYPGADVLALADSKVDRALAIWKRCLETNEWPAYPKIAIEADLPPYLESQWLEREARDEAMAA